MRARFSCYVSRSLHCDVRWRFFFAARAIAALLITLGLFSTALRAQTLPGDTSLLQDPATELPQSVTSDEKQKIAARVGDFSVTVGQVEALVNQTMRGKQMDDRTRQRLMAESLRQLARQAVVTTYLSQTSHRVDDDAVQLEIDRLSDRLKTIGKTLDEHLTSTGLTSQNLRDQYRWRLSWSRYLAEKINDENLKKFYAQNRREFDGTRMELAHLLIAAPDGADAAWYETAGKKAARIRAKIHSGEQDWGSAVAEYSNAPSADDGGRIGWINRRGPMPESFTAAVYLLKTGELSQPVETRFGVHLVKVLAIEPGTIGWRDAREQIRSAVTRYLFDWIVEKKSSGIEIEYTDAIPLVDPGHKRSTADPNSD